MALSKTEGLNISWWKPVLAVDLFLILITGMKSHPFDFPGKGKLLRHFDLAVEGNWAVWWSGGTLLLLAMLAYELHCRSERRSKAPFLILSVLFAALSLDEIGSLHERVMAGERGFGHVAPFALILVGFLLYALAALWRERETRRAVFMIAGGFLLYAVVALQERLEHILPWPEWAGGIRAGAEEGTELLGTFCLLLAVVPLRRHMEGEGFPALVPDPRLLPNIPRLAAFGLLLHASASLLVPSFIDVSKHWDGNPLVWYPVAVFLLLFSAAFWRGLDPAAERPRPWARLSAFFLLCSAGSIYDPARFIHDPGRYLPQLWGLPPEGYLQGLFLLAIAAGVLILSRGVPALRGSSTRYLPALLLLPSSILLVDTPEATYFISGFFAYLVFDLFRPLIFARKNNTLEETLWNPS